MYKILALFIGSLIVMFSLNSYALDDSDNFALTKIDIITAKNLNLTFSSDLQSES
jgi:hypothetical protein